MITPDDLQRLLDTEQKSATLVLVEGRVDVIAAGQLASPDYRGALEIVSREDLVKRLGDAPSAHDVAEQAGVLGAAVSDLGA